MEDGTAIVQSYFATDLIKVFCRLSAANVDFNYFGKNSF